MDASNNKNIKSVNHLQLLEKLNASGKTCGINDKGIKHCINIVELNIEDNYKIQDLNHLKLLMFLHDFILRSKPSLMSKSRKCNLTTKMSIMISFFNFS